jgi:glycosyltransferase involved in cell wall biosynthesis
MPMSELTISFVVPAYNEEALIASCLYAILAETSRVGCRAEIIVVDNNSTDRTRQIAAAIPGVVIVDEPQRGLVQARRAGCLAARGRLIANIDADTMIPPGWLDTVLAVFAKCPDLAALRARLKRPDCHKFLYPSRPALHYSLCFRDLFKRALRELTGVLHYWHEAIGTDSVTVKQLIDRATDFAPANGANGLDFNQPHRREFMFPDLREQLLTVAGSNGAINSYRLGKWLGRHKGRIVNGLHITEGQIDRTWKVCQ